MIESKPQVGYGYQQQPPQPSPYSNYGAPNQGYQQPPQQPQIPGQYGQAAPPQPGYSQMPQQQIPAQPTGYAQNSNLATYNMGYAPVAQQPQQPPQQPLAPQQYGAPQQPNAYGTPGMLPTYSNVPRPLSTTGSINNGGRSNSMSGAEKLRRIFNGVDVDGE